MRKITGSVAPLIACGLIFLAGCESTPTAEPAHASVTPAMSDTAGRAMVRTEIFFGLTRDDGKGIDESDWDKFVEDSISVWFPTGFTVIDARGRWRGADGKILNQNSKIVVLYHDGSEENLRKIDELRRLFTQRFGQQVILRGSTNAWVAF